MQVASMYFKERAHVKLHDAQLQLNLTKIKDKFVEKRRSAMTELDDFEGTRETARGIRQRALDDLDVWLDDFRGERRGARCDRAVRADARPTSMRWCSKSRGGTTCARSSSRSRWCRRSRGSITRSKAPDSRSSRRTSANTSCRSTTTSRRRTSSAPRCTSRSDEVAELFHKRHGKPSKEGIDELCLEARGELRTHYLTADMGISGGNFFVAETGSVVIVTNEGNATLTTTLPKVHVAISGIEKIVPTLEDLATLMRLLPRSATGQSISNYVDVLTGTKGAGEFNGAEHMYFILVDSGRIERARQATSAKRCAASAAARA